jgi:hypothetical protein
MEREQIRHIAEQHGLTYADLKCILDVETSGKAFDKEGNLYIQFEPHLFSKWLTKFEIDHQYSKKGEGRNVVYYIKAGNIEITNGVEVQSKELAAYSKAKQINEGAAMLSTSFGLGQILGENYALAGYSSARSMIEAFQESERHQVEAICCFLEKTGIKKYLLAEDFKGVASRYNGPAYYINKYDEKLKEAYEKAMKEIF